MSPLHRSSLVSRIDQFYNCVHGIWLAAAVIIGAWFSSYVLLLQLVNHWATAINGSESKSIHNTHSRWHIKKKHNRNNGVFEKKGIFSFFLWKKADKKTKRILLFTFLRKHWNGLTDQNTILNYYLNPSYCLVSGYSATGFYTTFKNNVRWDKIWKMKVIRRK